MREAPFRVEPLEESSLAAATALLAESCAFERAGVVAHEKLFGASPVAKGWAAGAWEGDALAGVASGAGKWLRVLAIAPAYRKRGASRALLDHAVKCAKKSGADVLRAGDQPGNYLAPGVDARDKATLLWLERQGFTHVGENRNLIVPLAGNVHATAANAAARAEALTALGYEIRRATAADAAAVEALAKTFTRGWAFEAARGDVFLAFHAGEPVAFAAHDGNNRGLGWFGPAGTLAAHRGKGVGAALLAACLVELAAAGHAETEIAWVGPKTFYEKSAGVARERTFIALERRI